MLASHGARQERGGSSGNLTDDDVRLLQGYWAEVVIGSLHTRSKLLVRYHVIRAGRPTFHSHCVQECE